MTLVEMLIVISIVAILAGVLVPRLGSAGPVHLMSAARVLGCDLQLARELAIEQNTRAAVVLDLVENAYEIRSVAGQPALEVPRNVQGAAGATGYRVDLDELPISVGSLGGRVRLDAAFDGETNRAVREVVFTPLGSTASAQETVVRLAIGRGRDTRYVTLHVAPATGQAWLGGVTDQP